MPWRVKVCQGSKWLWSGFLLSIQDRDLQPPRLWKAKSWSSASAMRFRHGHAMARVKVGKQRQNLPRSTWSCTVGLLGMMVENWTFTSESRSESAGCDLDAFLILSDPFSRLCCILFRCMDLHSLMQFQSAILGFCMMWKMILMVIGSCLVQAMVPITCTVSSIVRVMTHKLWWQRRLSKCRKSGCPNLWWICFYWIVSFAVSFAKPWPACLLLRHPCGMKLAREAFADYDFRWF